MFTFVAKTEGDTIVLAQALATSLPDRLSIGLVGTLGSGKTFFVRSVASYLHVDGSQVVSPTFTICNEYRGDRKIFHFDFYRIQDEDELLDLGVEEMFESNAISFIEWSDRFRAVLPDDSVRIEILVNADNSRVFTLTAQGDTSQAILNSIVKQLES